MKFDTKYWIGDIILFKREQDKIEDVAIIESVTYTKGEIYYSVKISANMIPETSIISKLVKEPEILDDRL